MQPPSSHELKSEGQQGLRSEAEGGVRSYNPINGRELGKILVNTTIRELGLKCSQGPFKGQEWPLYWPTLSDVFTKSLQRTFPGLSDELLAYPRANVKFDVGFTLYIQGFTIEYSLELLMYPQEEKRKLVGSGKARGTITPQQAVNLQRSPDPQVLDQLAGINVVEIKIPVNLAFNTDQIPPDALRVLNDLPVPTPTKVRGSNALGDGTASVVDVEKYATPKEKEMIKREFEGRVK